MGYRGIDIRELFGGLLFRAFLLDSSSSLIIAGSADLYLFELEADGTLKTYDWATNTFKTSGMTLNGYKTSLTYRPGVQHKDEGGDVGLDTGIWTKALTTLTGFTAGATCIFLIYHISANPIWQARQFQAGSGVWIATGDDADAAQLLARLTALRATYLDNLNVGGNVASSAQAVAIKAKTDLLGGATVEVRSPVGADGKYLELVRGDDYSVGHAGEIVFEDADATWPDLSDAAAITLRVWSKAEETVELEAEGELAIASDGTQSVAFAPTAAETAAMAGAYRKRTYWFEVAAAWGSGPEAQIVRGEATVWRTRRS